mgnify:CR=1 FL=1
MTHSLRLSSEATQSINEQMIWYESNENNGGPDFADRWLELLEAALISLTRNPLHHGFAPENGRWFPEISIRQLRFKPWKTPSSWRILYTIDEPNKAVTVLQIRHEKRPLIS